MAKKIVYTVEQLKEMYKDNFYLQHEDEMNNADKNVSTPGVQKATPDVAAVILDQKYDHPYDELGRAQYYHYLSVKTNGSFELPPDDKRLLEAHGVAFEVKEAKDDE